jgi:Virulence activator alpha C-term
VFTAELEQHEAAADLGDRHPRLALEHGLAVYRASLRWAEHAIATLSAVPAPSG